MKDVDLGEPTSFLDHVYLGCTQRESQISRNIVDTYRCMFESMISAGAVKNYQFLRNRMHIFLHGPMTWKVMQRSAWEYCELANKTTQQLYKVATPCIDDHQFKEEEMGSFREFTTVCSQIVLKCLYLGRIGRPDILWNPPRRSIKVSCLITRTSRTQQERKDPWVDKSPPSSRK